MGSKYHNKIFEYEGKQYNYGHAHYWVKSRYGVANHCDNPNCLQASTTFQWSNISHEYKLNRDDWQQLCRSCHAAFDMTDLSREVSRKNLIGNTHLRKAVNQIENGKIINTFPSIQAAADYIGVSHTAVQRATAGRFKAGGYNWEKIT